VPLSFPYLKPFVSFAARRLARILARNGRVPQRQVCWSYAPAS